VLFFFFCRGVRPALGRRRFCLPVVSPLAALPPLPPIPPYLLNGDLLPALWARKMAVAAGRSMRSGTPMGSAKRRPAPSQINNPKKCRTPSMRGRPKSPFLPYLHFPRSSTIDGRTLASACRHQGPPQARRMSTIIDGPPAMCGFFFFFFFSPQIANDDHQVPGADQFLGYSGGPGRLAPASVRFQFSQMPHTSTRTGRRVKRSRWFPFSFFRTALESSCQRASLLKRQGPPGPALGPPVSNFPLPDRDRHDTQEAGRRPPGAWLRGAKKNRTPHSFFPTRGRHGRPCSFSGLSLPNGAGVFFLPDE